MANTRPRKSTTVRTPLLIRAGFNLAERIAPTPAAKYLTDKWFKLPGTPQTRLRAEAPADATTFTLETPDGSIWGYDWGDGPLVYAFHGWGGCSGDLQHLTATLRANGMRVVAFDALSHGNSGPSPWGERYSSAVHIHDASRAIIQKFGAPQAMIAHSLGCLTGALALQEETEGPLTIPMVMMAPFVGGYESFTETLNSVVPAGPRIMERLIPMAEQRAGTEIAKISLFNLEVDSPTLIVHDKRDRPNPYRFGADLAQTWPNATMRATEGLGHRRILSNPEVISEVRQFLVPS
ncbi:alpha/beta fold hydrolase [Natronoglycomyces albus]|uniref:Alpha/beta fold hydrolase n=1 Tax=Natronoglycomyces albus TaxID=2811108 RepID=A0A895XQ27_9ACTN|nr:alpha/beta fold hydrolase [Natronoglycomyces albus]QSB05225.1 alpha/beta fold hydrolase [Natronoglycomyces albus]